MIELGILVTPGHQMMMLATASVFEFANAHAGGPEPAYRIRLLSEHGGLVTGSLGAGLETQPLIPGELDTLLVSASIGIPETPESLVTLLRAAGKSCRRLAGACTGAFHLGAAGLLDGRRATTHWSLAKDLQNRHPRARVEADRIFIADGPIWTSAGLSAGLDLALGLVEQDMGRDLARDVARTLVMHHRRGGGQSQHSVLLDLDARSDRIQNALAYARANLHKALTVDDLAEAARLSPRHFARAFRAETGQTPAKAVEALRLEMARNLVERSRHPLDVVARDSGFADPERMRRAFLRAYGQPPQALRRFARSDLP